MKEARIRQVLRFYLKVNPDDLSESILGKNTQKCTAINKHLLTVKTEETCSNINVLESKLPPPFNYELLAEILLNVLAKLRIQIRDKILWSEVTLDPKVDKNVEMAKSLLLLYCKFIQQNQNQLE